MRGTIADFLKGGIRDGSRLSPPISPSTPTTRSRTASIASTTLISFSVSHPSSTGSIPVRRRRSPYIIDADGLELANKLQQKRVAKECTGWIERKVDIKTIKQSNLLHGKMYHMATAGVEDAISSKATTNDVCP